MLSFARPGSLGRFRLKPQSRLARCSSSRTLTLARSPVTPKLREKGLSKSVAENYCLLRQSEHR
jgi:hypothetical protein